ncbi:hypothetical protein GIB67_037971 [Kingdonia uniflora]|uniref:Uncharacterized protein n=1 Tax=Kingdonia uniflora TaxID=39325 RepID=A0A7J7LH87_9MAGN|nr:hypothetical protein GIB67_037971 [Kingdonia uniflora]
MCHVYVDVVEWLYDGRRWSLSPRCGISFLHKTAFNNCTRNIMGEWCWLRRSFSNSYQTLLS